MQADNLMQPQVDRAERLNFCSGQVDLWLVFENEVPDSLLPEYRRMLTVDERTQEQRFHFAKDQRRYLITRSLIRTVLSRYSSHDPDYWRFSPNQFGRPLLLNGDDAMNAVSFNISHTDGLIICGISQGQAIGIDIENTQRKIELHGLVEAAFSPSEADAFYASPVHEKINVFFQTWTLKESYVKARGRGLAIPLAQVCFDFSSPGNMTFFPEGNLEDFSGGSEFWLIQPSPVHFGAICVERSDSICQRLVMRKVVPMMKDEVIQYPVLRRSNLSGRESTP